MDSHSGTLSSGTSHYPVLGPGGVIYPNLQNQTTAVQPPQLEYLFQDDYTKYNRRSWGEALCYGAGTSYLIGLKLFF